MEVTSCITRRCWTCALVPALLLCGTLSAEHPARFPIQAQWVVQCLDRRGLHLQAEQVHLPTTLTSADAEPLLVPYAARRSPGGRLQVQLRCITSAECLAFTVALDIADESIDEALHLLNEPSPGAAQHGADPGSGSASRPPLISRGQPVTLWLETGHLRIHLPAVALNAGAEGAQVRVAEKDSRKIYEATVLDAANVRGVTE